MKTSCKLCTSLFFTLCSFLTQVASQNVWDYVPADASFVLAANFDRLGQKVTMDELRKLDFLEQFFQNQLFTRPDREGETFRTMLDDPAKLGLDISQPLCIFLSHQGDHAFFNVLIKLTNPQVFEEQIAHALLNPAEVFTVNDTYNMFIQPSGKQAFAWNDDVLVLSGLMNLNFLSPPSNNFDYEYDEPTPEWPSEEPPSIPELPTEPSEEEAHPQPQPYDPVAEQLMRESQNRELLGQWVDTLMNRSFIRAISADENFRDALATPSDLHMWLNYSWFRNLYNTGLAGNSGLLDPNAQRANEVLLPMMEMFYSDTYLASYANFEDGAMTLKSKMYFNDDFAAFLEKTFDAKFNKRMLRYVKDDGQLFGYFFVNLNADNAVEEGKKLLYKVLDKMPHYGMVAKDLVGILGIVVDEKALGKLLKGDVLLYASGVQTMPVIQKTFDFDEDFNMTTKDTTVLKKLPTMSLLMSYGNKTNLMKFIELGLHSGGLQQEGMHYSFILPGAGMKFYLALKDGLLIVTNDHNLVLRNLSAGYARSQRLGKAHRRALRRNSSVFYWDISHTLREVAHSETLANMPVTQATLERLASEFRSMDLFSDKFQGKSQEIEWHLHLFDTSENFLLKMLRFVNELYLQNAGGART